MICAKEFECALHDRVFTLPMGSEKSSWRGILLTAGSGSISSGEGDRVFSSTSLVWAPWNEDMSLKIKAGSVGIQFGLTNDILANAIGHNAESSELRLLTDRMVVCRLDDSEREIADIMKAFDSINHESVNMTKGSLTMIEAQLRALLVLLWRNTPGTVEDVRPVGRSERVLQLFRHVVEVHFRDRWPIYKYADDIGISPDRLHDICTRHLGRTPKTLVQERELHEARQMLENTTLTVDQIATQLGFRDTAYFNRLFKTKIGKPPATYRRSQAIAESREEKKENKEFSDWP